METLTPYPPAALPLAPGGRFAIAAAGSYAWCAKMWPIKKKREGRAQALGGRYSIIWHINQPKDSVGSGKGIWEEMQPGGNMWGAMLANCLGDWTERQKINEI